MKEALFKKDGNYWTYDFYEFAPKFIDDKIPIVVPSYNDYKKNLFIEQVRNNEANDWPIYIVVRKSQYNDYVEYTKDIESISIVEFEDNLIDDIGKTRREIVNYFSDRYNYIFMLDGDVFPVLKVMSHYENRSRLSFDKSKNKLENLFSMWQLAHYNIVSKFDKCWCTYLYINDMVFNPCYGEELSYTVGGLPACCTCIDLFKIKESGINYKSIKDTGHDDIDLAIRLMDYGLFPISIKFLCSLMRPISNMGFDSIDDRLDYQNEKLYDLYGDTNKYLSLNSKNRININYKKFVKDMYGITNTKGSIKEEVYKKLKGEI